MQAHGNCQVAVILQISSISIGSATVLQRGSIALPTCAPGPFSKITVGHLKSRESNSCPSLPPCGFWSLGLSSVDQVHNCRCPHDGHIFSDLARGPQFAPTSGSASNPPWTVATIWMWLGHHPLCPGPAMVCIVLTRFPTPSSVELGFCSVWPSSPPL